MTTLSFRSHSNAMRYRQYENMFKNKLHLQSSWAKAKARHWLLTNIIYLKYGLLHRVTQQKRNEQKVNWRTFVWRDSPWLFAVSSASSSFSFAIPSLSPSSTACGDSDPKGYVDCIVKEVVEKGHWYCYLFAEHLLKIEKHILILNIITTKNIIQIYN